MSEGAKGAIVVAPTWALRYTTGGRFVTHTFYARDEAEARLVAAALNLPDSVGLHQVFGENPYQAMAHARLAAARGMGFHDTQLNIEALHDLTFLCFLALRAGILSADEVLSDTGVVHDAIHLMDQKVVLGRGTRMERARELQERVNLLAAQVPGYLPVPTFI